jgi:hypothetical protein
MTGFSRILLLLLLVTAGIAGCSSSPQRAAEYLDPLTGVTVTRSSSPLVLYRDNSARAAYARDFVYIAPVSINRMGDYNYYLWFGIWSSISTEQFVDQRDGFESIILFVDGEPLRLEIEGWTLSSIGVSEPVYNRPTATAAEAYYRVTIDQVRFIAEARDIRLRTGGPRANTYEPWDNLAQGLVGMRDFVRYLNN